MRSAVDALFRIIEVDPSPWVPRFSMSLRILTKYFAMGSAFNLSTWGLVPLAKISD